MLISKKNDVEKIIELISIFGYYLILILKNIKMKYSRFKIK